MGRPKDRFSRNTTQIIQFTLVTMECLIYSLNLTRPLELLYNKMSYRNDPKFSDIMVKANSADQDQTAPRGAV